MCYNLRYTITSDCETKKMGKDYDKTRGFRLSDDYMNIIENRLNDMRKKNPNKKISKTEALKSILDDYDSKEKLDPKQSLALDMFNQIIDMLKKEIREEIEKEKK